MARGDPCPHGSFPGTPTLGGATVIDIEAPAGDPGETDAPDFPPRPPLVPGRAAETLTARVQLVAGERRDLVLEYRADHPELSGQLTGHVKLGWVPPPAFVAPAVEAAAALAARSDVAIIVATDYETEMMDRPDLRLPQDQDALIRAVAAANPRTVVVLMTGAPVEVEAWRNDVAAVVEAWYAGQEQGDAIARMLFGDVDATGRLPLTFPRSLAETPVSTPEQYPGVEGVAHYREGIFVGYRGYDERGIQPRYPFGHGESYTTFKYEALEIGPGGEGPDAVATVAFELVNTGDRAGVEVAQVYVGRLATETPTPRRQLAGWARVALEPGERRRVRVAVELRSVSFWDVDAGGWTATSGDVGVEVGRSSRDARLTGTLIVP